MQVIVMQELTQMEMNWSKNGFQPTLNPFSMAHLLQKYITDNCAGTVQNNHYTYWVPYSIFNELPIKRWKHNRPPDTQRIAEIRAFMDQSKRMDGILYLACINKELVCYESNHRREALTGLEGMHPILVDILWDATDESVKAEFLRLNKAVSVPDLYVSEDTTIDTEDLIQMRNDFCAMYPLLKVNSSRPNAPNFNSDMILDEFHRMMKELKITPNELWDRLMNLNRQMSTRDRTKLSPKVIEKCERSRMWLFAWSRRLNASELV